MLPAWPIIELLWSKPSKVIIVISFNLYGFYNYMLRYYLVLPACRLLDQKLLRQKQRQKPKQTQRQKRRPRQKRRRKPKQRPKRRLRQMQRPKQMQRPMHKLRRKQRQQVCRLSLIYVGLIQYSGA